MIGIVNNVADAPAEAPGAGRGAMPVLHAPWSNADADADVGGDRRGRRVDAGGAIITTRRGGVSVAPYASLNLGDHVGDDPQAVATNRAIVQRWVGDRRIAWLAQCHGDRVVDARDAVEAVAAGAALAADAVITDAQGWVCAVMVADCLPVLLRGKSGAVVGAAHAGWRGLCNGVLERTVEAMRRRVDDDAVEGWQAFLGPAIGPDAFEGGSEVRAAFLAAARPDEAAATDAAFVAGCNGKFFGNLTVLARLRLARVGVLQISGGDLCTVRDGASFFSYRRDGQTGRLAALIWR